FALAFQFVLIKFGAQDLHGFIAVFVLRAFILACHHDPRGKVGDAHGGIGGVDVLAAFAAGTVGVHADLFRLNVDFDGVVNFRRNEDAGKGGMAAALLIERRDPDQAVNADLAGQQAVGVVAYHGEGGGLDAGFFRILAFDDVHRKALALRPARVHAQQHLRPILLFRSAAPWVNGYDGVARVVFAGEQGLGFQLFRQFAQPVDFPLQVVDDGLALASQIEVGGDIIATAAQFGVHGQRSFQAFALAHELLRSFL